MPPSAWWATKVRRFRAYLLARVDPAERTAVARWLPRRQAALFETMPVADQRHGLDVVASLRAQGVTDDEVLVAGLLHDAGKGHVGVGPRVAYSLTQGYGDRVGRLARQMPGWDADLDRLAEHAERSARLAAAAGCSDRTVQLIRHQEAPLDPGAGEMLRLADEAN
jgi:hypothetical protein